jgi:hypothetical protein
MDFTPEQEAEFAEQAALGREIAALEQSPWQPLCLAAAFATPRPGEIVFTLQHWIDLDRARSPLLLGRLPDLDELREAAPIFGLEVEALTAEEAILVAEALRAAVADSLAMSCGVKPPEVGERLDPDGFGTWLPLLAFLITQAGLGLHEALHLPVRKALPLMAAHRYNQGWRVTEDTPYALRDLGGPAKEAR